MIRALLGFAAPVLALGLASAFLAPSLTAGGGIPMIVSGVDRSEDIQATSYDGEGCVSDLALSAVPRFVATQRSEVEGLMLSRPAGLMTITLRQAGPAERSVDYLVIFSPLGRIVAIHAAGVEAEEAGDPCWQIGNGTADSRI